MKHYFFCAFLSLLLASCGGGGGGGSTSSSKKGAKECVTPIANGKGGLLWNKATKKYSTTCTVISCNAGYTISGRTCRKPKMLALGQDTSHVLFSTGEVEAWGKVSTDRWRTHIKENLGGNTPQALVSGRFHQCIILKNGNLNHGRLMCWGTNNEEQLGVGDTTDRTTPTAVTATILGDAGGGVPNTVKSVALGDYHTCAILHDDTVVCWGKNNKGQIGGGTGHGYNNETISGASGNPLSGGTASRIATGTFHTCAVLSDKSVKCWGDNRNRETGGGTPSLGVGKTATEIATGDIFSCAILDDGSVKCWGADWYLATEYIGTGGVPDLGVNRTATGIALGYRHACALLNDKTVKCWGGNHKGQIGGGTPGSGRVLRGSVGDPLGGETAIQIAAGHNHTCAIMESDNSVKCWGDNIRGQIVGAGELAMTGGSDGTGTSTGRTATLTAVSTPTATSLDSDANGQICKIELSGGTLGTPWVVKEYTTPLTYNTGGSTNISAAIDNMIAKIGSTVKLATTDVTLSRSGSDKIAATTDTAVFAGMTLAIQHVNSSGDCRSPVATEISLSGGSGGTVATGLWVISKDFDGTGDDNTVNLDSVHTDLGNTGFSKEEIADEIVEDVNSSRWAGRQYKDLPYTATKVENSDNSDCPVGDFCVLFSRVFKGTEGNYGIPFGDRDYSH